MVRSLTSVTTTIVVALVVMILFVMSGFITGLRSTILRGGSRGEWLVLSRGTTSEASSYITYEQYEILKTRPQIATDAHGRALISPEIVTGFNPAPDLPMSQVTYTDLRGVYPIGYEIRRGMRIVSGHWPTPGSAQMIVGRKLFARYPNLAPGTDFRFGRRMWKIVGIFADNDSSYESEVFTNVGVLSQDVRYGHGFASIHMLLRPGTEASFAASLKTDARLRVDTMSEADFLAGQLSFVKTLRSLGLVVALILAVGCVFGAMNTMYSAVARRTAEIGVLRVIGFSRLNILLSFVTESVLIGVAGGVLGEILGLILAFGSGLNSRPMNVGAFIFTFELTASAFISGLIVGAIIGALGGLLPALRASSVAIVNSVRAV